MSGRRLGRRRAGRAVDRPRNAHTSGGRLTARDVQEDRRSIAGHDRCRYRRSPRVVVGGHGLPESSEHREVGFVHRARARSGCRAPTTAVRPPVAADEVVVLIGDAGIGQHAVHRGLDAEESDGVCCHPRVMGRETVEATSAGTTSPDETSSRRTRNSSVAFWTSTSVRRPLSTVRL